MRRILVSRRLGGRRAWLLGLWSLLRLSAEALLELRCRREQGCLSASERVFSSCAAQDAPVLFLDFCGGDRDAGFLEIKTHLSRRTERS